MMAYVTTCLRFPPNSRVTLEKRDALLEGHDSSRPSNQRRAVSEQLTSCDYDPSKEKRELTRIGFEEEIKVLISTHPKELKIHLHLDVVGIIPSP